MALRRLLAGVVLVMIVMAGATLRPRLALASDNLEYIIPAAVGGAVMVVMVIAIIIAEHKEEPELDLVDRLPSPAQTQPAVRWGAACTSAASPNALPLFCW